MGYTHIQCDLRNFEQLPDIDGVEILVNNAGTQNEDDIDINLKSLIRITEKYGVQEKIHSILNIGEQLQLPNKRFYTCFILTIWNNVI